MNATTKKANPSDLLKLLGQLQNTTPEAVATLEAEMVRCTEPDQYLLHRYEPDFVDGYKLVTLGGHILTLAQIWDAYIAGENIGFVGSSGCGKSTIAFHLLDEANEPTRVKNRAIYAENVKKLKGGAKEVDLDEYYQLPYNASHISCHEATRSEDLIGSLTIKVDDQGNRVPVEVLGAVTDAWSEQKDNDGNTISKGKTLIMDELDLCSPGVLGECHQYFDGRTKTARVYLNGPRDLHKGDRFRLLATMNTFGRGENQSEFAGTQILNSAFLNRFTYVIQVPWLELSFEVNLIVKKTQIRTEVAKKMVLAAKQAREAHAQDTVDATITTRDLLSWARETKRAEARHSTQVNDQEYWKQYSIPSAYPTFISKLVDPNTRDMFDRYLGLI
ncbi:MAG: hypothetical protein D4S01_02970 [Dehalococcoidia bacterium]|nr:MAG: hypothetical protein D4S01_02970 [Dehalococcoidia bacterium]